ncbi:hypothetical protein PILCRDRAFT_420239 [Piloderma croceum F 1598]|uniref:CP-type G domain-containing protein n=1 Tax=Piloderma croceum (strain F 1598) TaxID=765440 RepID=A0A0C3BCD0_PILCF|nr:hypothetical protein PILCRDRAFT_420239 [Piloderma croceum F 1598]
MPAIRKKTSNRGTTNKRARIKGKAAESRKKQKRDAKKNVQWKSKHKKDPGIPNNFPYKDQILAEIAEERRQAAEEKQRRKDEKKAAKAGTNVVEERSDTEADGEGEGNPGIFDGVGSVTGKAAIQTKGKSRDIIEDVEVVSEDEIPILLNNDLPNLQSVLDQADVILQVLDARDPLAFRSSHLEELAAARPGQRTLLVLNKIDTVPLESITSWLAYLRTQHPTLPFRASSAFLPVTEPAIKSKGKEKAPVNDAIGASSILAYLSECAQEKEGDGTVAVAIVGLTNAGKSSLINSLLGKAVLPIYSLSSSSLAPSTTCLPQEVTLPVSGKQIRLIDTPGLSWKASSDESTDEHDVLRARDILLRNKGRIDRLKDPAFALAHIVSRADTEDLMLFYNLPAFLKGDKNAFLSGIARSNGMVKKAGVLDLAGAARIVLRDWSVGKFPRFTPAPTISETLVLTQRTGALAKLYIEDQKTLATLETRKEMRKRIGLVKLVAGHTDIRKVDVEARWMGAEHDGDDQSDEEVDKDDEQAESDEDDNVMMDDVEDLGHDESEEDDEPPPAPTGKRKRRNTFTALSALPNKKVAFAPDPKESKRARAAGSSKKAAPSSLNSKPVSSKLKTSKPTSVSRKIASQKSTPPSKGGDEVYDFGKFF